MKDLEIEDLKSDPFEQFRAWYGETLSLPMRESMVLSTVDREGRPRSRVVLLRDSSKDFFGFYTNYESDKAQQLDANPHASLVFWWEPLGYQVRVAGKVVRSPEQESDLYFQARPRNHQLGAWSSPQSRDIPNRAFLNERFREMERKFEGQDIPRPPHWGGYRIYPDSFEFWLMRPYRLHDRFVYRSQAGAWSLSRLAP